MASKLHTHERIPCKCYANKFAVRNRKSNQNRNHHKLPKNMDNIFENYSNTDCSDANSLNGHLSKYRTIHHLRISDPKTLLDI